MTLTCRDKKTGNKIEDSIEIELLEDNKTAYRLFVNENEKKLKRKITRENALSRCLTDVRDHLPDDVVCTFGKKVIYVHGDVDVTLHEPLLLNGESYTVDGNASIYSNGTQSMDDDGAIISNGGEIYSSRASIDSYVQLGNAWYAFWSAFGGLFSKDR